MVAERFGGREQQDSTESGEKDGDDEQVVLSAALSWVFKKTGENLRQSGVQICRP